MSKLVEPLKCLTCKENEVPQPEKFWKRTMIMSSVDKHGTNVAGKVPAKKQVAYICPNCEDLVRLMTQTNAYAGARPVNHPDGDGE